MKRFWLVLLSLGLIMAFSTSAMAVDVKVGAEYYVGGLYLNKSFIADPEPTGALGNPHTAFLWQRLRVGTDFVVSPCLKLVTRFDAMERVWGGDRSVRWWNALSVANPTSPSAATYNLNQPYGDLESQNLAFEVAYIDYVSPIGLFQVGYMPDWTWGTVFGNNGTGPTAGQIKYIVPVGPVNLFVGYAKEEDHSKSAFVPLSDAISGSPSATRGDRDYDSWRFGAIYNFTGKNAKGETGVLFLFNRDASNRGAAMGGNWSPVGLDGYLTKAYKVVPYFKAKVGPVNLQGEFGWMFGEYALFNNFVTLPVTGIVTDDIKIDTMDLFLDADANFGMFSVGGTFVYLSGDKNSYLDGKLNGGINNGGRDFNPCLIMFNTEVVGDWVGSMMSWPTTGLAPFPYNTAKVSGPMSNAWFYQLRAGVAPTKQLDVKLAVSYASPDKKGPGITGDYGTEIDLTGTYKITNNLSYMLGMGYLFTGDYFQGATTNDVNDIYMIINKLTLSF